MAHYSQTYHRAQPQQSAPIVSQQQQYFAANRAPQHQHLYNQQANQSQAAQRSHFGQVQHQLYQPVYANPAQQRPQAQTVQPPFAPQPPQAQVQGPPVTHAYQSHIQRQYGYHPPQQQHAQVQQPPPTVQVQTSHAIRTTSYGHPSYPPQHNGHIQPQQQPVSYARPTVVQAPAPPAVPSTIARTSQISQERRPLPTPGPGNTRPRPMSMPPAGTPFQIPPSKAVNNGHQPSASLSHIQSQVSPNRQPSVPVVTAATMSSRRPLPTPAEAARAISSSVNYQQPSNDTTPTKNNPFPTQRQPIASPTKSVPLPYNIPSQSATPPDLNRLGEKALYRNGAVSQMASKFGGMASPSVTSAPQRPPLSLNTTPTKVVPVAPAGHFTSSESEEEYDESEYESCSDAYEQSTGASETQDDEYEDEEYEDDTSSFQSIPSPHYGIRDLPRRNMAASASPRATTRQLRSDRSPQYGILDLPPLVRAKSVVERKKAWEHRFEPPPLHPMSPRRRKERLASRTPTHSVSPTRRNFDLPPPPSPVRSSMTSSPVTRSPASRSRSLSPAKSSRYSPVTPPKSPVMHHPQPSYTERQPSWTHPSATLKMEATSPGPVMQSPQPQPQPQPAQSQPPRTRPQYQPEGRQANGQSIALQLAAQSLSNEICQESLAQVTAKCVVPTPVTAQPISSPTRSSAPQTRKSPLTQTQQLLSNTQMYSSNASPRRVAVSLDDEPPSALPFRRDPSPSRTTSSASSSSIPVIRTPEETYQQKNIPSIVIPKEPQSSPSRQSATMVISPKPTSPHKALPIINLPDDGEFEGSELTMIAVSGPSPNATTGAFSPSMPIILNDLASSPSSSPTKSSRSLPQPPVSQSSRGVIGSPQKGRASRLVCGGCGESIIGRIVSAMGLRWHPQCFKCSRCSELLEHVSSYEHDGRPYCHLDYHELFAPQCYHCKTPIIDERFVTLDDPALGKRTYHEQHFFCAECGDPFLAPSSPSKSRSARGPNEINIQGDGAFDVALDEDGEEVGFTVYRGHPYCETCHVRLRAPKCKGCKKSIRDGMRAVEALGGKWCFECFVCSGCQRPFEEPSFFQRDKKPFCEPCFSLILRNEV